MEKVLLEGIEIFLIQPDEIPIAWVGQDEMITQVLAAWLVIGDDDLPLNPRILGKPGVGKTTLAYHAGRSLNQPVYLFQATMDTRPEDLIITPVISEVGKIRYMASPIVSAMIKGGVAVIDEGNRMSEKSWASLAPLMDNRRYVESIVAGIKIKAHPDFRICTTMNDDASTFELPDYIHSRLQPRIFIDFPDRDEEFLILKANLPFADEDVLEYVVDFLQASHEANERYSVRDGINIARYALKRQYESGERMTSADRKTRILDYMKESATMILDHIAADYFHDMMEEPYEE
ncbi:MoxR family ATPase [Deltaproteobacteria bacterium]|nr:MoxR family ATPase [Deltaproteobacteria bacterium]